MVQKKVVLKADSMDYLMIVRMVASMVLLLAEKMVEKTAVVMVDQTENC